MTPEIKALYDKIKWSDIVFRSELRCECRCHGSFMSHAVLYEDLNVIITRKSCPKCGRHDNCWIVGPQEKL